MERERIERLAILEERSEMQREQIDDLVNALHALTQEVTDINKKLERNMGFLGGMAFTFSMIGAGFGAFGSELIKRLTGVH